MSESVTIDVIGLPVPQGSLVSNGYGRGLRHSNHKELKPWRFQVAEVILEQLPQDWDPSLPLSVSDVFRFPRPQGHYGTGKNSGQLKKSAPQHHFVKPDCDKLGRSIGDSLEQGGIVKGDQQIVEWHLSKRYCTPNETPGALITLIPLQPIA